MIFDPKMGGVHCLNPPSRGLTLLMSRVVLLGRLVLHVLERLRGWEPVHDVTVTEPNPLTS